MHESQIRSDRVPKHVAIIMDGNGRWAVARGLGRNAGHREGIESVRDVVQAASDFGVECLTLYAFSNENWNRPKGEVSRLMDLFIVNASKYQVQQEGRQSLILWPRQG